MISTFFIIDSFRFGVGFGSNSSAFIVYWRNLTFILCILLVRQVMILFSGIFIDISSIFGSVSAKYAIRTSYTSNRQTFRIVNRSSSEVRHALRIWNFIFTFISAHPRQSLSFNWQTLNNSPWIWHLEYAFCNEDILAW